MLVICHQNKIKDCFQQESAYKSKNSPYGCVEKNTNPSACHQQPVQHLAGYCLRFIANELIALIFFPQSRLSSSNQDFFAPHRATHHFAIPYPNNPAPMPIIAPLCESLKLSCKRSLALRAKAMPTMPITRYIPVFFFIAFPPRK